MFRTYPAGQGMVAQGGADLKIIDRGSTFESTGEYREPKQDEYFLTNTGLTVLTDDETHVRHGVECMSSGGLGEERIILRSLTSWDIKGLTDNEMRYLRSYNGLKMGPILAKAVKK
ncbi:hypothetical protein LCGC14_3044390 [marine sediment metagenome]|uniref:Uncharacterized protein n=1 Tax=marine sediment metagenome TaxID=412755 RepID=A0A0F8WP62_9ZZZZ